MVTAPAPATPIKKRGWDASSHEALLLCLLDELKPSRAILTSVAEKMTEHGYSYSFDAINQHVQKLRKNRDTSGIQAASSNPASKVSTPRKATPRKRAAKKAVVDDGDDEELKLTLKQEPSDSLDEETETPKRANKRVKKTSEPVVMKLEDGEI